MYFFILFCQQISLNVPHWAFKTNDTDHICHNVYSFTVDESTGTIDHQNDFTITLISFCSW